LCASHAFVAHIEAHVWNFNYTSLTRLNNLLLIPKLAQRIYRLKFNSYRFSASALSDLQDHNTFTANLRRRHTYLSETLQSQLEETFRLATNLQDIHILSELLVLCHSAPAPPDLATFKYLIHLPNPLVRMHSALSTSALPTRLSSATILTRIHEPRLDWTRTSCPPLECAGITRLAIDTAYLMDPTLTLPCPNLVVLEIMHIERWTTARAFFNTVHKQGESTSWRVKYGRLREVMLTGSVGCGCGCAYGQTEERVLYTSAVFVVVQWMKEHTKGVEKLGVRRARVVQDTAREMWEVGEFEEFEFVEEVE
jgi:hypothetical protein